MERLISAILQKSNRPRTVLVGIDGCGGSGKSTFAEKLKQKLPDVTVVHMDDFHRPSAEVDPSHPKEKPIGTDIDWQRLLAQVIEPVKNGKEGNYQRYDWDKDLLAEWHRVPMDGIVVIEGVYSTRKELADLYDATVWIQCPRELRLSRGLERDGESARSMWEDNWMVGKDLYIEAHGPDKRADFTFEGTE